MIAEQFNPEPKPLRDRLKKKILKVKREAIEELLVQVRNSPSEFQPYEDLAIEFLSFNDQVVQDKSLKILALYLGAGNSLSIEPKAMIRTMIEKCLCVEKEEVRANAEEILFWYMDNKQEGLLLGELNDDILHKNKKVGLALRRSSPLHCCS
jgi:hypothetical protein